MTEFRTIEIDFQVHKRIEAERNSFAETPNAALRRLLQIRGEPPKATPPSSSNPASESRAWSGEGAILPHGTALRMDYNGRRHTGGIDNGAWIVEGKRFKSPSGAASGVAITKDGQHTRLDGWIYWYVKRPGDTDWIPIEQLRSKTILSIDDL
jgi:hypothetical protein